LNTLTKSLVILLTISSIFLCGIVVTYVSHAQNYKEAFEEQQNNATLSQNSEAQTKKEWENAKKDYQNDVDQLNAQIAQLKTKTEVLTSDYKQAKTEKVALDQKVQSWVSMVQQLTETNEDLTRQVASYVENFKLAEAEQMKLGKKLEETITELLAKHSIIESLEADKKAFEQDITQLRTKLDSYLQRRGTETSRYVPITSRPEIVSVRDPLGAVTPPAEKPIGLKSTITNINIGSSLAEISLGSAHGVREGMRFFVTRQQKFICVIEIIDVEPEKSIGQIKQVQPGFQPQRGDSVVTNL
jgi:outer membrane murein-binding lipoprotein Lpp